MNATDAVNAFINPLTSVINVWVGMPSSGAIGHSKKVDIIDSVNVVMLSISVVRITQLRHRYLVTTIIDVIDYKYVVTKIVS